MKGLVYIGKIIQVNEIPSAERIESLEVVCGAGGKWRGTAQKNQFKEGDTCEVYLQDSLLPQTEEFAFMEKHHYRVKIAKFLGVPSEVLIMPQTIEGIIGHDITFEKNVTKYEKPVPINSGAILRNFPSFIPKTDEPNFQSVSEMVQALQGQQFYSSVKVDGMSGTAFRYKGRFGVCSRNWELKKGGLIWQCAVDSGMCENMPEGCAAQFEVAGPSIQKNPLGLGKPQLFVFNLYDIEQHCYLDAGPFVKMFGAAWSRVEILDWDKKFDMTEDQLREYAEGTYPNGKQREGVVIRPMRETIVNGERLSFKVINPLYKG